MSPLDDELRSLFTSRANELAPTSAPVERIERRARKLRRNRVAGSVVVAAVVVGVGVVALPSLRPAPTRERVATATSTASPSTSPSTAGSPGSVLDPAHPWSYRGDPAVLGNGNLATFRRDWATAHPGSTLTPLFGPVYEPSRRPEVVFVATGGSGDRWGVVTSGDAGSHFLHDEALAAGSSVLMAALAGDEVPRLIIVAGPETGRISYAHDGRSFHPLTGPAVGVAFTPLEGDTTQDAVQVLDGQGRPVFEGPAPDAA